MTTPANPWTDGEYVNAAKMYDRVTVPVANANGILIVANAAARPTTPYDGQPIYQRDVDKMYFWDGTVWELTNAGALRWIDASITLTPGQISNSTAIPYGVTYAAVPRAFATSASSGIDFTTANETTSQVTVTARRSDNSTQGTSTSYTFKLLIVDAEYAG